RSGALPTPRHALDDGWPGPNSESPDGESFTRSLGVSPAPTLATGFSTLAWFHRSTVHTLSAQGFLKIREGRFQRMAASTSAADGGVEAGQHRDGTPRG